MAEFFLEIFSEEIPARMLVSGQKSLRLVLESALGGAGLPVEGEIKTYATPRRLVAVAAVPERTEDTVVEHKGPRVGAPTAAIAGFLKRSGLARIEDADEIEDRKGAYYLARLEQAGVAAAEILPEVIPQALAKLRWPKSMRWGGSDKTSWVRPVRSMICLLDGEMVELEFAGVKSARTTRGHRTEGPSEPIEVDGFKDYCDKLKEPGKVILDSEDRKEMIRAGLKEKVGDGFEHVEDEELLAEVAGLVEYPVVLRGDFARKYLELPDIIIREAMRRHQKYFAVRRADGGAFAPCFLVVANQPDSDEKIVEGNQRVLEARLADAQFFWDKDCKTGIDALAEKVKSSIALRLPKDKDGAFLLSMEAKLSYIESTASDLIKIAREAEKNTCSKIVDVLAQTDQKNLFGAATEYDEELEKRFEQVEGDIKEAVRLCKADLESATVGEFPALQGQIGALLALQGQIGALLAKEAKKSEAVCRAIEEHYRPRNPDDEVPDAVRKLFFDDKKRKIVEAKLGDEETLGNLEKGELSSFPPHTISASIAVPETLLAVAIGLADRISHLVFLAQCDEWPGGATDRFAMRRTALSIVRILQQSRCLWNFTLDLKGGSGYSLVEWLRPIAVKEDGSKDIVIFSISNTQQDEIMQLIVDRYKTWLEEVGAPKNQGPVTRDIIESAFNSEYSIEYNTAKIYQLKEFLNNHKLDSAALIDSYKRVNNIARRNAHDGELDESLFEEDAEKHLHAALTEYRDYKKNLYDSLHYYMLLKKMAGLFPGPINDFLDQVRVMDAPGELKTNRLALLAAVRDAIKEVADLSKLQR